MLSYCCCEAEAESEAIQAPPHHVSGSILSQPFAYYMLYYVCMYVCI